MSQLSEECYCTCAKQCFNSMMDAIAGATTAEEKAAAKERYRTCIALCKEAAAEAQKVVGSNE